MQVRARFIVLLFITIMFAVSCRSQTLAPTQTKTTGA